MLVDSLQETSLTLPAELKRCFLVESLKVIWLLEENSA